MPKQNSNINKMKDRMVSIDLECQETHVSIVAPTGETIGEMGLPEKPEAFSARAEVIW
jgi:2C-methyl-D-erythritol 2,4-cyclodiphosphate synthase